MRWPARRAFPAPHHHMLLAALIALGTWATGCAEDLPQMEPPRPVIQASWDPATGVLPSPSDLVRDAETGKLNLPISPSLSPAEQEFRRYLNTLNGYPITSTMSIPVTGPIDPATLPGTVLVTRASDGRAMRTTVAYDAETSSILISPTNDDPDNTLQPGERYVFGLRGYAGGAKGAAGESVVADAGFYLVRQEQPLSEHLSVIPGDSRAEREATAQSLEEVRQAYQQLYTTMGQRGVPREELAVVSSFTVASDPSVWFDPNQSKIPVPNAILMNQDTGLVDLPIDPEEPAEAKHVKEALNRYDGFSSSGAMEVEATEALDVASATDPANVRVFRKEVTAEGVRWVEETDLERGVLENGHTLWVRPRLALREDTEHVYIVTRDVKTASGQPLVAQPVGALLNVSAPLVDAQGTSLVSTLTDSVASALEPARQSNSGLLRFLETQGIAREDLAVAVPFRTSTASAWLMKWRAKLYTEQVPTTLVNAQANTPRDLGLGLLLRDVRTVVTGKVTTLDHLDPRTR